MDFTITSGLYAQEKNTDMTSHCVYCPKEFENPDELSTHLLLCKARTLKDFC